MPVPSCNHYFILQDRYLYHPNIWKCRTCPKTITCLDTIDGVYYSNTYNPNNHTRGNTFNNIINFFNCVAEAVPVISENNTSKNN
jgi:hypothetical protein